MGVLIAIIIISSWGIHLVYSLGLDIDFASPVTYLHIFLQGYLFTGLFITAHDAMHGTVSRVKIVNKIIGYLSAFLFAGMSYNRLIKNHFKHHRYPGTEDDPDFYTKSQNFWLWFFTFMKRYTTIFQIIVMAAIFNILKLWFGEMNIWFYWVIPALLGALQLFFFGTYLPHKKPHTHSMEPHQARTQNKNHLWAMLSCYFFGYHFEHHDSPHVPWWQLYKEK